MANLLKGTVASIRDSGQLISDITEQQLENVPRNESTIVKFAGHTTIGLFSIEHGQPDSTLVAFVGKSGALEIEIVGISLTEMLRIKTGEPITVSW